MPVVATIVSEPITSTTAVLTTKNKYYGEITTIVIAKPSNPPSDASGFIWAGLGSITADRAMKSRLSSNHYSPGDEVVLSWNGWIAVDDARVV